VTIAGGFLGYAHLVRGDLDAAVPVLEHGLTIAEEHDLVHGIVPNALYLAMARLLVGDVARGREVLTRALQRPAGTFMSQWTRYGTITAAVYLMANEIAEARGAVAEGLALVAERDAVGYRAPLMRLEAEGLLRTGEIAEACRRAEQALQQAEAVATRPEIAHCHWTLARATAALKDLDRSRRHQAMAVAAFRELGMPFWAERATTPALR
jgi:hypothetical protein